MRVISRILAIGLISTLPLVAFAKEKTKEPVGTMTVGSSSIEWAPSADHDALELTVTNADGDRWTETYKGRAVFSLRSLGNGNIDGSYNYELRLVPRISGSVKQQLAAAREAGDDAEVARIMKANGLNRALVQSGAFMVLNGAFVVDAPEADANDESNSSKLASNGKPGNVQTDDQVIPDDLIVQSSTCTGFDCVDGESFGFDTFRLKENNLRIHFEDTSSSAGYPANDWRIVANDSASGGANKFVIEDSTAARNPMTIEAAAPANSLYVKSTGKIGIQQSNPSLDVHVTTGDTPAFRLEQTNAGGFTAQTWDIGANEANFFVRDLTGGSRLPFRIRPGAPTSSVDIAANGWVGIGGTPTTSFTLTTPLQITSSNSLGSIVRLYNSDATYEMGGFWMPNTATTGGWLMGTNNYGALALAYGSGANENSALLDAKDSGSGIYITTAGNIGVGGLSTPTNPIEHTSGARLTAAGAWTSASSCEIKEDIYDISPEEAHAALSRLEPVHFKYKVDPADPQVGFIAEDVPEIVATSDRRGLNSLEIVAVLTKVVQEQQKTIDQLNQRLEQIEKTKQQ